MANLTVILAAVLALSFVTFVAFFGRLPAFRKTPIGFLSRLLWIHIPNFLRWVDRSTSGGRARERLRAFGDYLMNQKHPLVLIFFLSLVYFSAALFLPNAWKYLTITDKITTFILLPTPFLATYLCQKSGPKSPHLITAENHAEQMRQYPFDYMLFYPGTICRTCQFEKPARSKHCSLCNTCVARCDHHCIWVNNCVGRGNHKWFLALCLSTGLLVGYGAFLSWKILQPMVHAHLQRHAAWHEMQQQSGHNSDYFSRVFMARAERILDIVGTAFDIGGLSIGGIGLLCLLTFPLPLALFVYHLYLVWAGTTTNESSKWADWREDMATGSVFIGELERKADRHGGSFPEESRNIDASEHVEDNIDWPYRSRSCLIMTADGMPPRHLSLDAAMTIVDDSWRPIYKLRDVVNIYDLGFWENLMEILSN